MECFFEVGGSSIKEKLECSINFCGVHLVGSRGNTPGGGPGGRVPGSSEVLGF